MTIQSHHRQLAFSLGRFESLCYSHQHEAAAREFLELLAMLDRNYGAFDHGFVAMPTANLAGMDQDPHIINRICSALSSLFSDPGFHISIDGFRQLIFLHRWIATLFSASSFRNADHILRALNINGPEAAAVEIDRQHLVKFCLLYTPNSEIPIDLDALFAFDRNLASAFACALLSPRFLGTESAHRKREALLEWLPEKLDQLDDIDVLPLAVLHDVYMHCSYADTPRRHAIKASINRLVRKKLLKQGITDLIHQPRRPDGQEKPVMMVVLEWFNDAHSIFRTHSASLRAARERFRVVGIGQAGLVDESGRSVFDEHLEIAGDTVDFVREQANRIRPDILYYPAFGMFPHSIYLTNLRLAPLQIVSYGHPATSMSPHIDCFVLPEDWIGDPACFSERLLPMPEQAMPFVPSSRARPIEPTLDAAPDIVRIAIAATPMKLNPRFLDALTRIRRGTTRPVQFHFFMGLAQGMVYLEVQQFLRAYLPDAVIHAHLPYDAYMTRLNTCDLYLNPFPFGNTNGIVDVTSVGLVGVCKTGPEVLEHIDGALFKRLDLPQWLIANTVDEYVAAAVRLITDTKLRLSLRRRLIERGGSKVLFEGTPERFGEALEALLAEYPDAPLPVS